MTENRRQKNVCVIGERKNMFDEEQSEQEEEENIKLYSSVYDSVGPAKSSVKYDVELFIDKLRDFPCIWDPCCTSYRDQDVRKAAWEEISKTFDKNVEFLKLQWKNLRDNLRKCLLRREKMAQAGAEPYTLSRCKYFKQLIFLHDKVMNKEPGVSMASPDHEIMVNGAFRSSLLSPINSSDLSPCEKERETGTRNSNLVSSDNNSTLNTDSSDDRPFSAKRKARETSQNCYAASQKTGSTNAQLNCMLENWEKTSDDFKSNHETKQCCCQCDENEDSLFFKSLIPTMRKFSPKKNKMAKMKIQQLLFDLEFGDDG